MMLIGLALLAVAQACPNWVAFLVGSSHFRDCLDPEDRFRAYRSLYSFLM